MFSIEKTRRGIEKAYGVSGLSGCEVPVRFDSPLYGEVVMWAPTGTVPEGEEGHFWVEVQRARLRLQAEFQQMDENRVYDPGGGSTGLE